MQVQELTQEFYILSLGSKLALSPTVTLAAAGVGAERVFIIFGSIYFKI